jgi:tetratricopeptide (TPR) repeat protein
MHAVAQYSSQRDFRRNAATLGICATAAVLLAFATVRYVRAWRAESHLSAAVEAAHRGDFETSVQESLQAVEWDPQEAYAYGLAAVCHERTLLSLLDTEAAMLRQPGLDRIHSLRLAAAIRLQERAVALNPQDDAFAHNLGWLRAYRGDWRQGLHWIDRALLLARNSEYLVGRGLMLERLGDLDPAWDAYAEALAKRPGLFKSPGFAQICERLRRSERSVLDRAVSRVEAEIRQKPSPLLSARLASLQLQRGDFPAARSVLAEVTSAMPNLPYPWLMRAQANAELGRPGDIELSLRRAYFLDRSGSEAEFQLARFLEHQGRFREASTHYANVAADRTTPVSEHSSRVDRLYLISRPLADDLVPSGLLALCTPGSHQAESKAAHLALRSLPDQRPAR